MSTPASTERQTSVTSVNSINAGIDSAFANNPTHRGSLTPDELDSIHQTNSFKQALQLQEEDNRELAAKTKLLQRPKPIGKQ